MRQLAYKRRYKEEHPEWDDSMVFLTNLVRERIGEKSVVLDFGCGRGNFVIDELRPLFERVIGFDVAQESTDGNVTCGEIFIGDPLKIPLADASVDVAISLWVFEHVEHPEAVVKEISRVLKPGGFFACVTPNKKSLLISLRRLMSDGIAHALLKRLYGREEKDAFSVFYRANTSRDLVLIARTALMTVERCIENADPSYTAFNTLTYRLSTWFARCCGTFARPHLISILRKP